MSVSYMTLHTHRRILNFKLGGAGWCKASRMSSKCGKCGRGFVPSLQKICEISLENLCVLVHSEALFKIIMLTTK